MSISAYCQSRSHVHEYEIPYSYQLAQAFVIAVPTVTTIWAVYLLVVLRYGKNQVNRLTLRPLWWTLFLSVVQIAIGIFSVLATPYIIWYEKCQD